MMENTPSIVSTWELPRRGHDGPDEDGAVDCINLGPERFREQVSLAGCRVRTLYQPGIWMSSRTHHPDPTHDAHCINLESGIETRTTR